MKQLQKILSRAGICSRRAAEQLMAEGRVSVNGSTVTEPGSQADPTRDRIEVDGRPVRRSAGPKIYLALNKPRGYVTTLSDPEGRPTVAELIREVGGRVFPVGRLDYHSEGLLLLTNDGELASRLLHPGCGVDKTYAAKVRGRPDSAVLGRLSRGFLLEGRPARPSRVRMTRPGHNSWIELTVAEGRKHLVRRMLQAVGHPVLKLRRVRFDGIRLGALPSGHWRHLTLREVARLRRAPKAQSA